ncbi:hypothetical protein [Algoriphagus sp.]|uniref:hypothetical protein n=1 Tax=Algoriphagus sp. TaxID=1872435 RepID=UPI00391C9F4D
MVEIFWSDLAVFDLKTILSYIKVDSRFYADDWNDFDLCFPIEDLYKNTISKKVIEN